MDKVKRYLRQVCNTFSGQTPHIHFDIAGPATTNKASYNGPKGPTGFMIPTIVQWLKQQ